jgi:hypothetical protein
MVPWAVNSAIHHQTFCEQAPVMRARRVDGKELSTPPSHGNRFAKCVPQEHSSFEHLSMSQSLSKSGPLLKLESRWNNTTRIQIY